MLNHWLLVTLEHVTGSASGYTHVGLHARAYFRNVPITDHSRLSFTSPFTKSHVGLNPVPDSIFTDQYRG